MPHRLNQKNQKSDGSAPDLTWVSDGNQKLKVVRQIGDGLFAEVFEIENLDSQEHIARKTIKMRPGFLKEIEENIQNEKRALLELYRAGGHRNIIQVFEYGAFATGACYYFDMELCSINLKEHMSQQDTSNLQLGEIYLIMKDVTEGVAHLHRANLAHRDIKPQNVLYSIVDKTWKLADFGLTMEISTTAYLTTIYGRGTAGYRAPEILKEPGHYNKRSDIWSLGCILFELIAGEPPFTSDFQVFDYALNKSSSFLKIQEAVARAPLAHPNQIEELIVATLKVDPQERPSASDLSFQIRELEYHSKRRASTTCANKRSQTLPWSLFRVSIAKSVRKAFLLVRKHPDDASAVLFTIASLDRLQQDHLLVGMALASLIIRSPPVRASMRLIPGWKRFVEKGRLMSRKARAVCHFIATVGVAICQIYAMFSRSKESWSREGLLVVTFVQFCFVLLELLLGYEEP